VITFRDNSDLGLGFFIQVLRDGRPLGRIFRTTGGYRFHVGDEPTLGAAILEDEDLDRLEAKIRKKYEAGLAG
jgi:hypothetical protein